MENSTKNPFENIEKLFNLEKYDEILTLLTDEELELQKNTELYVLRGKTWNNKKEYDNAITDYNKALEINPTDSVLFVLRGNTLYNKEDYNSAIDDYKKAIEINPNYELAFYNMGAAWFAIKDYKEAIKCYSKAIEIDISYADAYISRGNIKRVFNEDYDGAIDDYNEAIKINPEFANAYYNRGLAKKENNVDPEEIKQDFEKYLKLITDENDIWAKYARYYIEELSEKIEDPELWSIKQSVNNIKDKLLIKEECVHYTSLSRLKKLIIENSKFRISEGNFMNDPSEGKEFFKILKYKPSVSRKDGSITETFSPKPFIGSFVTHDKDNDLNMWRFYGKEAGIEAKGCSITLHTQEFIEDVKDLLADEKKEARLDNESDIHFYRVVYVVNNKSTKFHIPNLNSKKSKELTDLMAELKKKIQKYKTEDKTSLEVCLNNIAFLFKSDAYKNENEVRLVVKGIEFPKKYDMDVIPPRVYIELESIKKRVKQITLGPKVDNVNEWASDFYYSYKGDEKVPKIKISLLPYK